MAAAPLHPNRPDEDADDRDTITLIPPAFSEKRSSVEPVPPTSRRFAERHRTVVPGRDGSAHVSGTWRRQRIR